MEDTSTRILSLTTSIIPFTTGLVALVTALAFFATFLGRASVRAGNFKLDIEKSTREKISRQVGEDIARGVSPQNALMREYHAQGLSQSRISFWFSLTFASLGFAIIALSIGLFLESTEASGNSLAEKVVSASKPLFTLVAGTVIDAVAALFFVQSNKARQLMVDFFDKLRIDRKLDEALSLIDKIQDPLIASRVKSIVALNFSDVALKGEIVNATLFEAAPEAATPRSKAVRPQSQRPLARGDEPAVGT